MKILTMGIDLAENAFTLHAVNEAGKPVLVRPPAATGADPRGPIRRDERPRLSSTPSFLTRGTGTGSLGSKIFPQPNAFDIDHSY